MKRENLLNKETLFIKPDAARNLENMSIVEKKRLFLSDYINKNTIAIKATIISALYASIFLSI